MEKSKIFSEKEQSDIEEILSAYESFLHTIDRCCPEGRTRSLALTKLQETMMWSTYAVLGSWLGMDRRKK